MIEMQTKQTQQTQPKPSNGAQSNYAPTQPHLQALNHKFIDLLGDGYGIELDKPHQRDGKIFYPTHCVFYTHDNDDHYDENPSAWIGVSLPDGRLSSGCFACGRAQFVLHDDDGEMQPAPTLLTLSRRDERLLKTLLDLGCKEFPLTVEEAKALEIELPEIEKRKRKPRVGFPVVYADGSKGFHFRVAVEGKEKWRHMEGGKAGEAVFGLYNEKVKQKIQSQGFVIITESPFDAALLIAADFPAIGCCGKNNVKALGCDQHRETLLSLLGDNCVVYVWREPDAPETPLLVANALQRPVKVINPPVPEDNPNALKDAFRLWLACEKDWVGFKAEIDRLIANATEIAPQPEPVPVQPTKLQTNGRKVEIPETIFKRLSDIEVKELQWLIDEYIPIGAVTLLAGEGGAGKSTLLCDLTAAILKGDKWLGKFEVLQGGVILILTEGVEEIRSRLDCYGITDDNPLEIVDLTAWEDYEPLEVARALPEILQIAKERLQERFGDIPIRLVVLDCLRGFGFDETKASRQKSDKLPTVREIYKPLAEFAKEEGSAVIATHHSRKPTAEEMRRLYPKRKKGKEVAPDIDINLLRNLIAGTADIVNAARHALVVVSDLEAGLGIIVPVKSNRSQVLGAPIRYDFYAETPTFLEFLDEEETAIETAIAFLRRVLSKGEIPSKELEELAKKEGISSRTLKRARQRLRVKARYVYVDGKGIWIAYLPNQANQTNQPDQKPNPLSNSDPLSARPEPDQPTGQTEPEPVSAPKDSPDRPDPHESPTSPPDNGSLTTNPVNFGTLGTLSEKPKQNLEFCRVPTEKPFDTLGTLGGEPVSVAECQECQAKSHWHSTLALWKSPINTSVSEQECQECQTFGNSEGDPLGNPPDQPANETRPETADSPTDQPTNELGFAGDQMGSPTDKPEGDLQPTDPLWLIFDGVLPELVVGCPPVNEPEAQPEPAGSPEGDRKPKAKDLLVSYTAEVVTEPVCPACETELEPERNGKAACLGCGRLYFVVAPPQTPANTQPAREPDHSGLAACVETHSETFGGCVFVATSDWIEDEGIVVVTSDESPPEPANEPERPEPTESPTDPLNEEWLWDWLTPESLQTQSEISPPDEREIEFIQINSISQPEPEGSPEGDLQDEPEEIPPDQPVATLTEPICPYCGEILEPDPESGLATCAGCGRLFKVEIPPDDDNNPPESPDGGDGGNPPAILNRMTVRQPDRSIKLVWQDKTETVAPEDLAGWQPIETIPEISLPNIESVEIPPVVVLDIETTDLDPQRGRILAAGLALYVEGKEVETQIIRNEGDEAALLAQTFDWLRETCDGLGGFILTGYNLFDFDLPYLIERARRLKVDCPFRFIKDENGEIKRWRVAATEGTLRGDPLDYPAIVTDLPIRIVDTQHLVCRWDYTAKQLRNYDLKSVAAHFGVNQPDRPILSPAKIVHAFKHDPATFEAYLLADLRETYALFAKLIPPYAGVAALTGLPLDLVAVKSTAWVWEQILKRHYNEIPQADEKRKYKGGLVVSRKGLWSPCLKIDIASLYPTIMLAYRIHSCKDPDQIGLRWLKTLTRQRLELKAKAKAGDANAQVLQEAMKILLNSLYGFYGAGGYPFNDMNAAEKVTEIGRKVLTCMIAAIEDAGGIIVEADTDGLIVCYRNADPQEILKAVNAAIPPVFKVEVEWQEAIVFVSDDKNYMVIDRNGDLIAVKGSRWRGRDKEAYQTQAIPTFVRIWATQGIEAALAFAVQTLNEIRSGQGWRWVVRTHRVGKGDKFLIEAGFEVGEIATYAYKDKKRKIVAKNEREGYDCKFYAGEFSDLVKEVIEAIDLAQIAAWERMVASEARPLIFR